MARSKEEIRAALKEGISAAVEPEITFKDRLILNNLFDTQPKKRAAYLQQIGFEIDPNDDNKFRPLNSPKDAPYVGTIDPSYHEAYQKGGLMGFVKELGKDVGDVGFDTGIQVLTRGLAAGEGAAAGGEAGALAGAPLGPGAVATGGIGAVLGGIGMAVASGSMANASAEFLKSGIGDILLDKNIPQDKMATAVQSFVAGSVPLILQGGGKLVNRALRGRVELIQNGIKNAAAKFGPNLTDNILVKATENPEMYDPETTKQAGNLTNKFFKGIFGLDEEQATKGFERASSPKPGSLIGDAMQPLNYKADKITDALSADPEGNFKVRDVLSAFNKVTSKIEDTGRLTGPDDAAALGQIQDFKNQILKKAAAKLREGGIAGPPTQSQLLNADFNFGEVRGFAKSIKDSVKNAKGETIPGGEQLMQIAGSGPGQLGSMLTQKADDLGTDWTQVQAQRHDLLGLAKRAVPILKTSGLENLYLGDQTSAAKAETKLLLNEFDDKLGTNLSKEIENVNTQRAVQQFYQNPKAYSKYPLAEKIADVVSAAPNPLAMAKEAVTPSGRIQKGQNVVDLLRQQLDRGAALDRSFYAPVQSPTVAGFDAIRPLETAASKVYKPGIQPEDVSGPSEPQSSATDANRERIRKALLEGI